MDLHQQLPFFNPSVPFNTPIHGGLLDGMSITVSGRVLPDADRFDVNLMSGSDLALHFNPHFKNLCRTVVQNTYQNGTWGEGQNIFKMPFLRGQLFFLQIFVTMGSYKISANGKPFSEFNHRIPFSCVDQIHIGGMMELNLVAFQYLAPHHSTPPGTFLVPYKSIIHGGVKPGKVIILQGVITPQGLDNRMEIILRHQTGIAFYYSPRFDYNDVVLKSYRHGKWSVGKRSGQMPFERGQSFLVTICRSHRHYKVFVNGEQTHTYLHHFTKLEDVDVLEVTGDVKLTFVQV
ncbi:galectin-9-like [Chanodichthys erythropterus]|uniref:galectin-9-like n=1 Tax=Chanodichthys erythropterus TaxID=933992 RepID=UPI00351F6B9A